MANSRRNFIWAAAAAATAAATSDSQGQSLPVDTQNRVQLSQVHGSSEQDEIAPGPFLPASKRVGYAVVGLGRLSIDQILPAFGHSEYCRPVALVSGDHAKALKIAGQYGIPDSSIYDYRNYEQLAQNPAVQVIYVVLPNGMHEEYVV